MTYDLLSGMSGLQMGILMQMSNKRTGGRSCCLPDCPVFKIIEHFFRLLVRTYSILQPKKE